MFRPEEVERLSFVLARITKAIRAVAKTWKEESALFLLSGDYSSSVITEIGDM